MLLNNNVLVTYCICWEVLLTLNVNLVLSSLWYEKLTANIAYTNWKQCSGRHFSCYIKKALIRYQTKSMEQSPEKL